MNNNIIAASGGHGSTYIQSTLRAHKRPDVVFGDKMSEPYLKLSDIPSKKHRIEFKKRTGGWNLDLNRTIEDNMVRYLEDMNNKNIRVLVGGRISRLGPFFSVNPIENVICFVRHPLHAMVSFLVHRHPEKTNRFEGGLNSESCVEYYASIWNATVCDHIEAGSIMIRYEFAPKDAINLKDNKIKQMFSGWHINKRNPSILQPEFESLLKELVKDNYTQLYNKWEI